MNELDRRADELRLDTFRNQGAFTPWNSLTPVLKEFWRAKVLEPGINQRADELRLDAAKRLDPDGIFGPLTVWEKLPESTQEFWRKIARKELG